MLVGQHVYYVHVLYKKYGPVVRINPNKIAIADPLASKEIYAVGSRFLKEHVNIGPVPNIFSITDPK
jgi:hypothetical protein